MEVILPGKNVKVFGRAIHSLSRVGDEIYVEPNDTGISFRTVSLSRSAYGAFTFAPCFFSFFGQPEGSFTYGDLKSKIAMKSCLSVFKSPVTLDRQVASCRLRLDPSACKFIIEFRCHHGIIKSHLLPILDTETVQAIYAKANVPNMLKAQSSVFCEAVVNFQNTQDELSLTVTPQRTYLRNYILDAPELTTTIRTQLALETSEFDEYSVGQEATITFSMKEFRGLLSFSETVDLPVEVNFETAGRPVVFIVNNPMAYELNLVLSTLPEGVPMRPEEAIVTSDEMVDVGGTKVSAAMYRLLLARRERLAKKTGAKKPRDMHHQPLINKLAQTAAENFSASTTGSSSKGKGKKKMNVKHSSIVEMAGRDEPSTSTGIRSRNTISQYLTRPNPGGEGGGAELSVSKWQRIIEMEEKEDRQSEELDILTALEKKHDNTASRSSAELHQRCSTERSEEPPLGKSHSSGELRLRRATEHSEELTPVRTTSPERVTYEDADNELKWHVDTEVDVKAVVELNGNVVEEDVNLNVTPALPPEDEFVFPSQLAKTVKKPRIGCAKSSRKNIENHREHKNSAEIGPEHAEEQYDEFLFPSQIAEMKKKAKPVPPVNDSDVYNGNSSGFADASKISEEEKTFKFPEPRQKKLHKKVLSSKTKPKTGVPSKQQGCGDSEELFIDLTEQEEAFNDEFCFVGVDDSVVRRETDKQEARRFTAKLFRKRCIEPTFSVENLPGYETVYAESSDPEDANL